MSKWSHFYLIRIEFLGFRYHGWQKQNDLKSVHGMVDKTLLYILKHEEFKTLGCGRTDAKVSANDFAFELFINEKIHADKFLSSYNKNLPTDIRAKSISRVDAKFNIIQSAKVKEYHYYFSYGEKSHPFNAPFIQDFGKKLNIPDMMEAAKAFEGVHNFKRYSSKPSPDTVFEREIISSSIEKNDRLKGSFIPSDSYVFRVAGKGFMRYQVRLMMAALVDVGTGIWSISELKQSMIDYDGRQVRHVAPSSGLVLHRIDFES